MVFPAFMAYRGRIPSSPITELERQRILNPILQDNVLKRALGLKMLGDERDDNNFLGYLMATGAL
jgi:hypothetical protein